MAEEPATIAMDEAGADAQRTASAGTDSNTDSTGFLGFDLERKHLLMLAAAVVVLATAYFLYTRGKQNIKNSDSQSDAESSSGGDGEIQQELEEINSEMDDDGENVDMDTVQNPDHPLEADEEIASSLYEE